MNVLSLFNGINCGRLAFDRAGIPVERYVSYEIDEKANQVSNQNYPETEQKGDVFAGNYSDYKGFDILIGGSPCTFWSINKKDRETTSAGFGYELFSQYVRALEESQCPYFLYENNYKIHPEIQELITKDLGVKPILINSALVSAQQRFRLYWTNLPNITQPEDKHIYVRDIINYEATAENLIHETIFKDIDDFGSFDKLVRIGTIGKGGQGNRVYSINGKSSNLTASSGGKGGKTGLYKIGETVRKLTPLEAERLQNLPDNFTEGLSTNQRLKCIGNGWTVDVIAHIFKGLKKEE